MFSKHFASKNQLPGFYISGTLVENGLKQNTKYILIQSTLHLFELQIKFTRCLIKYFHWKPESTLDKPSITACKLVNGQFNILHMHLVHHVIQIFNNSIQISYTAFILISDNTSLGLLYFSDQRHYWILGGTGFQFDFLLT